MNNKLIELANKANEGIGYTFKLEDAKQIHELLEKFGKLIIQDALEGFKERIATRYQGSEKDQNIGYGMEIVMFDIMDKFGVEE